MSELPPKNNLPPLMLSKNQVITYNGDTTYFTEYSKTNGIGNANTASFDSLAFRRAEAEGVEMPKLENGRKYKVNDVLTDDSGKIYFKLKKIFSITILGKTFTRTSGPDIFINLDDLKTRKFENKTS